VAANIIDTRRHAFRELAGQGIERLARILEDQCGAAVLDVHVDLDLGGTAMAARIEDNLLQHDDRARGDDGGYPGIFQECLQLLLGIDDGSRVARNMQLAGRHGVHHAVTRSRAAAMSFAKAIRSSSATMSNTSATAGATPQIPMRRPLRCGARAQETSTRILSDPTLAPERSTWLQTTRTPFRKQPLVEPRSVTTASSPCSATEQCACEI
jgi:hypothetical protein